MNVMNIKISKIKKAENYRGKIGDVSELMSSIKENGLLQPIGVTKEKNGYEIVFGNRRLSAVTKLGEGYVKCVIVKKSQNKTILNIVENMQREDVSLYEVGRAINRLIEKDGLTKEELVVRLGTNKAYIKSAIDAFSLTPPTYRTKVVSMDYARKGKKKGLISSGVSSAINSTAARFHLTKKQVNQFYKYASENQLSNSQIRTICTLMNEGLNFDQAIKEQKKVRIFRAEIIIRADENKRLIEKYGKSYIREIINGQTMDVIKPISKKFIMAKAKKESKTTLDSLGLE